MFNPNEKTLTITEQDLGYPQDPFVQRTDNKETRTFFIFVRILFHS